jgi:(p)ppGpp synthase/HD superfamily hydrolase
VPYVAHLMAVSALVLEDGGDVDSAVAALLHDVVEDTPVTLDQVRARFGPRVASLVAAASEPEPKPAPWRARKEAVLAGLASLDGDALRIVLADKLHNARSTLADRRRLGPAVWSRFNAGPDQQLWWYRSLATAFATLRPGPMADELASVVAALVRESRFDLA